MSRNKEILDYLKQKFPDKPKEFFEGVSESFKAISRRGQYLNNGGVDAQRSKLIKLLSLQSGLLKKKKPKQSYTPVKHNPRNCLFCGDQFQPFNNKQRYCKPTHSPASKRAKKMRKLLRKRGHRVPGWVDMKQLDQIYSNRPPGMVVDHIIPLNGTLISGLHVPENLQYLTPEENQLKRETWDGTLENNWWRKLLNKST